VKVTTFALWLACASVSFAQSTWGDLTFGVTVKEASEKFSGNVSQEPIRSPEGPIIALSLTNPISVGDEQGRARLLFKRATEKRYLVALDFSDTEVAEGTCFSSSPASDSKKIRRLDVIGNGLIDQYGAPASESGSPWPTVDRLIRYFACKELESISSKRIWRESGQAIEADINLVCGHLFINVFYRSVGSEL
jgi:hypothetical protein